MIQIKGLGKSAFYVFVVCLIILAIVIYFSTMKKAEKKSAAASGSTTINSKTEWETGSLVNIDSTTAPGSIQISVNLTKKIFHNDDSECVINPDCVPALFADDNTGSGNRLVLGTPGEYAQIDFLGPQNLTSIKYFFHTIEPDLAHGAIDYWNGSGWQLIKNVGPEETDVLQTYNLPSPVQAYKVRFLHVSGWRLDFQELEPFSGTIKLYLIPSSATHTSTSTQINGGDNFFQWQTFTPTQTVPPVTTSVSYKFRTSPDGSSWTSWSASQTPTSGNALDISSLVTSKSGDTYYKYIQVETTLSNTDGASTPTVDSYSVGYHTNVKPNKPTAQTAVIGN